MCGIIIWGRPQSKDAQETEGTVRSPLPDNHPSSDPLLIPGSIHSGGQSPPDLAVPPKSHLLTQLRAIQLPRALWSVPKTRAVTWLLAAVADCKSFKKQDIVQGLQVH